MSSSIYKHLRRSEVVYGDDLHPFWAHDAANNCCWQFISRGRRHLPAICCILNLFSWFAICLLKNSFDMFWDVCFLPFAFDLHECNRGKTSSVVIRSWSCVQILRWGGGDRNKNVYLAYSSYSLYAHHNIYLSIMLMFHIILFNVSITNYKCTFFCKVNVRKQVCLSSNWPFLFTSFVSSFFIVQL